MAVKAPKILYFIDGPVPNASNRLEANAMKGKGAQVVFRNARFADETAGNPEPCDGVAGDPIPDLYKKSNVKSADDVLAKYAEDQQAEADAMKQGASAGDADNLGSHSLPSLAHVPVRAR